MICKKVYGFAIIFLSGIAFGLAYRIGDPVDTIIWTRQNATDATTGQMPQFGIPSSAKIQLFGEHFSLGFEEGAHVLPWVDGRRTETLFVTFVYSRNAGVIHSVSSMPTYKEQGQAAPDKRTIIMFQWVQEEPVDTDAGLGVMFLAVLVVSILYLFEACGLSETTDENDPSFQVQPHHKHQSSHKWGVHDD